MIHPKKIEIELMSELKTCCQFYSPQWNEWIEHKGGDYLTEQELYALSVFKNNHFKIKMNEGMMFYNKPKLIEDIIHKLQTSKKEFKEWLIDRWQFWLIKSGIETDLGLYLKQTIDGLNINTEAKQSLIKFGKNSLGEIFATFSDKDFASEEYFEIIQESMTSFKDHIPQPLNLKPFANKTEQGNELKTLSK